MRTVAVAAGTTSRIATQSPSCGRPAKGRATRAMSDAAAPRPWQSLYRFPLPQGQGSRGPTTGTSAASTATAAPAAADVRARRDFFPMTGEPSQARRRRREGPPRQAHTVRRPSASSHDPPLVRHVAHDAQPPTVGQERRHHRAKGSHLGARASVGDLEIHDTAADLPAQHHPSVRRGSHAGSRCRAAPRRPRPPSRAAPRSRAGRPRRAGRRGGRPGPRPLGAEPRGPVRLHAAPSGRG